MMTSSNSKESSQELFHLNQTFSLRSTIKGSEEISDKKYTRRNWSLADSVFTSYFGCNEIWKNGKILSSGVHILETLLPVLHWLRWGKSRKHKRVEKNHFSFLFHEFANSPFGSRYVSLSVKKRGIKSQSWNSLKKQMLKSQSKHWNSRPLLRVFQRLRWTLNCYEIKLCYL